VQPVGSCFTYKTQPREGRRGLEGGCLAQRPAPGGTGEVLSLGGEADTESREEEKDWGMSGHWHGRALRCRLQREVMFIGSVFPKKVTATPKEPDVEGEGCTRSGSCM